MCRQPYKRVLYVPGTPFLGTYPHDVLIVVGRYLSPETFVAVFVITNSFKHVKCLTVNIGQIRYGDMVAQCDARGDTVQGDGTGSDEFTGVFLLLQFLNT